MKSALCFLFFFLILISGIRSQNKKRDTLFITEISAGTEITNGNVRGVLFTVKVKDACTSMKKYNSYYGKDPLCSMELFNEKDLPVKNTYPSYSEINSETGEKLILQKHFFGKDVSPVKKDCEFVSFFLPYYLIELKEGKHMLKLKFKFHVYDTLAKKYTSDKVFISGNTQSEIEINKPAFRKVKILCDGLRITEEGATSWDFGLNGRPDLIYKIQYKGGEYDFYSNYYNTLYRSTEMQNATSAAWMDYSDDIIISDGDKVTLGVYDNDTLSDDLIGNKDFSIESLLEASEKSEKLFFGKVTYFTLKVKEVK